MIHELRADQPVHFRLPTGEILALWWDETKRRLETLQAPESVFKLYQPTQQRIDAIEKVCGLTIPQVYNLREWAEKFDYQDVLQHGALILSYEQYEDLVKAKSELGTLKQSLESLKANPDLTETTLWYKIEGPQEASAIPTPDEMLSQAEQAPVGGMG